MTSLETKILNYKTVSGDKDITHVLLCDGYVVPYKVPLKELPVLHEIIEEHISSGGKSSLVEKPKDKSILFVDLDFEFEGIKKRQHNSNHIDRIVSVLNKSIDNCIDILRDPLKETYVLQRKDVYIKNGNTKDGIHILYPNIPCTKRLRRQILEDFSSKIDTIVEDKSIGILNVIDKKKIVDKCASGLVLPYSSKPGTEPYLPYQKYYDSILCDMEKERISETLNKLSIFNYSNSRVYDCGKETRASEETIKVVREPIVDNNKLDFVRKLLYRLPREFVEDLMKWRKVGMCLKSINPCLKEDWVNWSKSSDKWQPSDVLLWDSFPEVGYTIGTLIQWSKGEEVKDGLFGNILDMTHYSIANLVVRSLREGLVCVNNTSYKKYYIFRNGRWLKENCGIRAISDKLNSLIKEYSRYTFKEDTKLKVQVDNLVKIIKTQSHRDQVTKICNNLLLDTTFIERLDVDPYLLNCKNCIVDIRTGKSRESLPSDMVSLSTNIDFREEELDFDLETWTSTDSESLQIMEFFEQIFPDVKEREFVFKFLSSTLYGGNLFTKFVMFTGVGANGKSLLANFLNYTLGEYCSTIPGNFLTSNRQKVGTATPDLVRIVKVRIAFSNEPNRDRKLNSGFIKELTGDDNITFRGLYENSSETKNMSNIILVCNNPPEIDDTSEGMTRRLVVVPFNSRFVENPIKDNEFEIDYKKLDKLKPLSSTFLNMLVSCYPIVEEKGLDIPESIVNTAKEYKKEHNVIEEFIDECIVPKEGKVFKLKELYAFFVDWFKDSRPNKRPPIQSHFKKDIEVILFSGEKYNKHKGWIGYEIVRNEPEEFGTI